MKKILFALFILISFIGYSQPTTITGYTTINNKYNWLAITTRALNIPAGTTPSLATGQWVGFGGLYADSTGGNKGIHYWNGSNWIRMVDTTMSVTATFESVLNTSSTLTTDHAVSGSGSPDFSWTGFHNYLISTDSLYLTEQDNNFINDTVHHKLLTINNITGSVSMSNWQSFFNNTSIGTGFPIAWDGTNQIRKLAAGSYMTLDSATSNTITINNNGLFGKSGGDFRTGTNRTMSFENTGWMIFDSIPIFIVRKNPAGNAYAYFDWSDNDGTFQIKNNGFLETMIRTDGEDYGWVKWWIRNQYSNADTAITHIGYSSAATGILFSTNNGTGIGQIYKGFLGNAIINDGTMIRESGNGGLRFTGDVGPITFTKGVDGTNEYARFITAGRMGIGTSTPNQKLTVSGSFSNNDSTIHSNIARLTDTTGFDIAALDRSTGNMKKIYPGLLGGVNIYNNDGSIPGATIRTVSIGASSDLVFFGANSNEISIGGGASSTAGDVLIDAEAGNVHLNSPHAIVAQSDSFRTQRSANVHQIADSAGWYFKIRNKLTGTEADAYWPAGGSSGITIGSTTITGGSSPNILYHTTEGFVGEYSVTGSGSTAVLSTTPTFTTSIIDTLVVGSTSANGRLVLTGNNNSSGNTGTLVNTTIAVGNSSGTPALRAYNSGEITINGATYDANHALVIKSLDNTVLHGVKILANNETAALSIGYNGFSYSGVLTVEGLGGINIQGASSAVYGKMTSAGLWNIGGSNTGTSSLTVQGTFAPTLATSAIDVTLGSQTTMILTATGKTATLPTAVGCQGRIYIIKLSASGSGTVATTSSQTIDGATTYSLSAQYKYVAVESDNANWHIIANN